MVDSGQVPTNKSLRLASEVQARRKPGSDAAVPVSEILIHQRPTGKLVSGAILETAVGWNNSYLLFMTDDLPFEDMLGIYLLDSDLELLDSARIGGAYTTGSFRGLELEDPNTVRFHFIGETEWTVELLPESRPCLPILREAPGVRRPLAFFRHFRVRGSPRPDAR
jgi:hypothetical protein